MEFAKYESIGYEIETLLSKRVVITEKIHGTNCRISYTYEDGLILGSRNNVLYQKGQKIGVDNYKFINFVFDNLVDATENIKLFPGFIFYGEYFGNGIQKGIKYFPEIKKGFKVFDIRTPDGPFMDWELVKHLCQQVGFQTVPQLGIGKFTKEELKQYVNVSSTLGRSNDVEDDKDNITEGIVVKPTIYSFNSLEPQRAKLKSDRFLETINTPGLKEPLSKELKELKNKAEEFAKSVVTNGRIFTIVEHITRDGNTIIDMTRTSDFIKELNTDIWNEHFELKNSLTKSQQRFYNKEIGQIAKKLWIKFVMEQL